MSHVTPISRFALFLSFSLISLNNTFGIELLLTDTCAVNDDCITATTISNVISDHSYVCVNSCNLNASPDPLVAGCQMGDYPTVWFMIQPDNDAAVMNIEVRSDDFESPVISLFDGSTGCNSLEQVNLSNSNLSCIIGSDGVAMAVGTPINSSGVYYLAVSSLISIGGNFEVCVSTISKGSYCVVDRNLQITARENGGSLEGPFDPGEKITVCMNVNQYTAAGNGCQWFQGIVPVFGNGWDPSFLDALGQPFNASVNGISIDSAANGIYGASRWDWFNDVGYHHNNRRYTIGDFDHNGRIEMCNSSYEIDCPGQDSIKGGCCGPCWEDPGDILPAGWFAYGINGSCPTLGPPIKVDWGDGNTCGAGMGPWSFCFDLVTRDTPDCLGDSTKKDLTLGFYTFADGEIGAWTGGPSVCAYDQPVKLSFKAQCGRMTTHLPERLHDLCSGEIFRYRIEEPGIDRWEWNISPYWAVPLPIHSGENGFVIESPVYNQFPQAQKVTGILIGRITGSQDVVIRKFYFYILPCGLYTEVPLYVGNEKPSTLDPDPMPNPFSDLSVEPRSIQSFDQNAFKAYPVPAKDFVIIEWSAEIMECENLIITDLSGKLRERATFTAQDMQLHHKRMNIESLASGVYIISFLSGKEVYSLKLVKI